MLDEDTKKVANVVNISKAKEANESPAIPEFVRIAFLIGLSACLSYLAKELDNLVRGNSGK